MKTKTILTCFHGSHLYGMSTPQSDVDIYSVYTYINHRYRPHLRKQAKQKMTQNEQTLEDKMVVSIDRFSDFCMKGVPQAIEVLYSSPEHWIEFHPDWIENSNLIKSKVINRHQLPVVMETYRRTAYRFVTNDDFKKNRHAMRLCLNAQQLRATGVMQPTLSPEVVTKLSEHAKLPYEHRLEIIRNKYLSVFDTI